MGARMAAESARPPIVACLGMSFWKQARIASFFEPPPVFCRTTGEAVAVAAARAGAIGVWATREPPDLAALAAAAGVRVARIEDGFIRSVGLGSDFRPGASI